MSKQITAIIVGAGHRAMGYASYAKQNPEKLKIVGVADPMPLRRKKVAEEYGLAENQIFESAEVLAKKGKLADAVINGTMDKDHVATSLPLLEAGYDMLLEKPIAVTKDETLKLNELATKYKRKVMICHVLRYAPFYVEIKRRILNDEIGEIINIQTNEHVSYHHMGTCYVRGKWRRKDVCGSSMLMAKCCHDLDLIMWMKSGTVPRYVSSFGSRMFFRAEKAPEGAGEICLVNCPIENDCSYSARKHYLNHPDRWSFYVWSDLEHIKNPTLSQKEEFLRRKDNPFGRCIWKCDNNVVDHQSVLISFDDGCTVTHNMVGGASRPQRSIHLMGTKGEIQGVFDENKFVVRHIDTRPGCEYSEEKVDLNVSGDTTGAFGGHGGGDLNLVDDFVRVLQGETPSISYTSIDDSINGHLVGFAADKAMEEHKIIDLKDTW